MLSQKLKRYERNMQASGSEKKLRPAGAISRSQEDLVGSGPSAVAAHALLPLEECSMVQGSTQGQHDEPSKMSMKSSSQTPVAGQVMRATVTEDKENAGYQSVPRRRVV
jgi:hypothetical protein